MCIEKNVWGVENDEEISNFGINYEIRLPKLVLAGGPVI
jgi:hypothetical protein